MSRTATAAWKRLRRERIEHAISHGITACPICGTWLDYTHGKQPNSPEVDHIVEHAKGGADSFENTRVICRKCNQSRGGKFGNRKQRTARAILSHKDLAPATVIDW